MSTVLKVTEATSLAVHAAVILAEAEGAPRTVAEMASILQSSQAHLAKVMQRLAHAGLATATRGPRGGFVLARPAEETTLLHLYETIEGPLCPSNCLLGKPACAGRHCVLGDLVQTLNQQVRDYLSRTTVADLVAAGVRVLTAASDA
ncbi:MAG: RrF2 family transcriptional regulator [Chloroflexota bacterium]